MKNYSSVRKAQEVKSFIREAEAEVESLKLQLAALKEEFSGLEHGQEELRAYLVAEDRRLTAALNRAATKQLYWEEYLDTLSRN